MADRATSLLALTIFFCVAAWITVSLRCYVRIRIVKLFASEDWLMVVSLLIFTVLSAFLIAGVHYGIGKHNASLSPADLVQALKFQTLSELAYIANTAFIKLSVGLLLRRISPSKTYNTIISTSMIILTLWTAVTFFIVLFQCRPVYFAWDQSSGKGSCFNPTVIADAGYAFSAMDIFFDWLFALLPVPMLWDVQMSAQLKLSILLILSLGVFASTATIVRLKYIVTLTDTADILYSFSVALIWSVIEPGIAISAASVATLRPLFKDLNIPGFSSNNKFHIGNLGRDRYHQSYNLGSIGPKDTTVQSTVTHSRREDDNNSEDSILVRDGIQKRIDVEMSYGA